RVFGSFCHLLFRAVPGCWKGKRPVGRRRRDNPAKGSSNLPKPQTNVGSSDQSFVRFFLTKGGHFMVRRSFLFLASLAVIGLGAAVSSKAEAAGGPYTVYKFNLRRQYEGWVRTDTSGVPPHY